MPDWTSPDLISIKVTKACPKCTLENPCAQCIQDVKDAEAEVAARRRADPATQLLLDIFAHVDNPNGEKER